MNQLKMVKLSMTDIPEANVPEEYGLRVLKPGEKNKWEELCDKMFKSENKFEKIIGVQPGYREDGVFVITDGDKLIATGTALCDCGCVHMIAADSEYSGKKLGYEITAAVLRRLRRENLEKAWLTTDDFRLPAIKSYYNLGFIPDLSVDETMRERWENIYKIFGWELNEYI